MTRDTTKIARGATALFSSSLLSNLLIFAFYIAITHLLTPASLGVLYTFTVIDSFLATFLLLSLPGGFSRFITGFYQTGRLAEARYLFRRGLLIATIICSTSAPILLLLGPYITRLLFGSPDYILLYNLVVLDFVVSTYSSFLGVVVSARRVFGWGGLIQVLSTAARVGVGVGLIVAGLGLAGVLAGWIASDLVCIAAYAYLSRSLFTGEAVKSELKEVFLYSLPLFMANSLVVVLQNVDRLFVLEYLGTVSLGIYGTVLIASNIPKILPSSISNTLYPVMVKYEEEKALTKGVVSKAVRYMVMVNLPILGLVAATGAPLLQLFLGTKFSQAWPSFSILVFGAGAMSLDIPITQVLLAKKKTKVLAVEQLVSSFLLALCALLLIPRLFLIGAALAFVLARIGGFIVVATSVYRLGMLGVEWRDYFKTFVVTGTIASLVLVTEHLTDFRTYLLPLYLALGGLAGLTVARFINLFNGEEYRELYEFVPPQLRGLLNWVWEKFGLPKTR